MGSSLRRALELMYARRLRRQLKGCHQLPTHIGVIMDGNRRWATAAGYSDTSVGHQQGAEHLEHLLRWCQRLSVRYVTVFICSTENIANRSAREVAFLMNVIETTISSLLTRPGRSWRVHVAGSPAAVLGTTAAALQELCRQTETVATGQHLTLAVGYGGRQEILDAFTSYLREQAAIGRTVADLVDTFDAGDIDRHLYQPEIPNPDLIIRTSGERRSSNFLLWQASHADYFFCDAYWPAFSEVDLLRAARDYTRRRRSS